MGLLPCTAPAPDAIRRHHDICTGCWESEESGTATLGVLRWLYLCQVQIAPEWLLASTAISDGDLSSYLDFTRQQLILG